MPNVVEGDYFFRLQTEVPPDGNLAGLVNEICHKIAFYEIDENGQPNYKKIISEKPEITIIKLPNPTELEDEFPGLINAMRLIQIASITLAKRILYTPTTPPEPEVIENNVEMVVEGENDTTT